MDKFIGKIFIWIITLGLLLLPFLYSHTTPKNPALSVNYSEFKVSCDGGSGSSVLLDNGKILTAAHVIEGDINCYIQTRDFKRYLVKVDKIDKKVDLALLSFISEPPSIKGVKIAESLPEQYSPVFVLGHPGGIDLSVYTSGTYQGSIREDCDLITTPISHGSSGGPAFILNGNTPELIGIVDATYLNDRDADVDHLAVIVNLPTIKKFLYLK